MKKNKAGALPPKAAQAQRIKNGAARNYVARNPLLRKGGAHVRAKSGDRFSGKQQTMKAAREWQSSRAHSCAA